MCGPARRRTYSDVEKASLVAKSLRPGFSAAGVARRAGVHPQLLYTWRRQARDGRLALPADDVAMFAAVVAVPEPDAPVDVDTPTCEAADDVVIELGDLRLRIGTGVPADRVAALVAALRERR
ncbi:MAG: transposase [Alphaproteobacteria bacterium]